MIYGCLLPALLLGLAPQDPAPKTPAPKNLAQRDLIVRAARIVLEPGTVLTDGALLIRGGKIAEVGDEIPPEAVAGAEIVDYADQTIVAGFVDPHGHLGLGADLAERSNAFTPELRTADAFDPFDPELQRQASGGVTTTILAPLSANTFGGIAAVVRNGSAASVGRDAYLKLALVRESLDQQRYPTSQMGATELMRRTFGAARANPADASATAKTLRDAMNGSLRAVFHARTHSEITSVLELCEELSLEPVLLGADEVLRSSARLKTLRGSVILAPLSFESKRPALELPAQLEAAGIAFSFSSVAGPEQAAPAAPRPAQGRGRGGRRGRGPSTPAAMADPVPSVGHPDALRVSASLAARHGLSRDAALAAITRTPAAQCGIAPETGTLRRGSRADFLVFDGDPTDLTARLRATYQGGRRFTNKESQR